MYLNDKIYFGMTESGEQLELSLKMANRHGLIAGATGTGKTTTLKVLAESFSDAGVPVFMADAKGDLQGMAKAGADNENLLKRKQYFNLTEDVFKYTAYPVNFWDVYGEQGIRLRTTISEMGPVLLSRIMDLNDTQSGILNMIFKIADDNELLLIDTKDLKSMIQFVTENAKELSKDYGSLSAQSLNVILRAVINLEADGGEDFFGEPALDIKDWIALDRNQRGFIQVLECQKLMLNPKTYAMFLLWMISELYETLPEAGDLSKPKMVFFFDEAHMLFEDAPKILLEKIEQVVKLIRSKGVGIYFITQNPNDIPDGVLSQLGNKIQHGLRAYTPNEQKKMKAAAQGFRVNPEFDTLTVLGELGTGEAVTSVLDDSGVPTIVKRVKILPPQSYMGTLTEAEFDDMTQMSYLNGKYNYSIDNESAYERLQGMAAGAEIPVQGSAGSLAHDGVEVQGPDGNSDYDGAKVVGRDSVDASGGAAVTSGGASVNSEGRKLTQTELYKQKLEAEKAAAATKKDSDVAESDSSRKSRKTESKSETKSSSSKSGGRKTQSAGMKVVKQVANSAAGTVGREMGNNMGSAIGGKFGKKLGGNMGATFARGIVGTFFK